MKTRYRRQLGCLMAELLGTLGICLGLTLALVPLGIRWQALAGRLQVQLGARAAGSTFSALQQRAQYLHQNHVRFNTAPDGKRVSGFYGTRQKTVLDFPALGLGGCRIRTQEGGFAPSGNGEEAFTLAVYQGDHPERYQLVTFSPFVGRMEYHGAR